MRKYLLFSLLFLGGCSYYQPAGVSSAGIGGPYERPVGVAEGRSTRWEFFPCWALCPAGEGSLKEAVDNALAGTPGDTLANVFVDRQTVYFPHPLLPLVTRTSIIVTGTLVKYTGKEFPPDDADLVPFRRVYDGETLWSRLLPLAPAVQDKALAALEPRARAGLREYLEFLELRRGIKKDSPEAALFLKVMARAVYEEQAAKDKAWDSTLPPAQPFNGVK